MGFLLFCRFEISAEIASLGAGEGDLGERQREFFRGAVDRGEERAVLVASASPQPSVEVVERAFHELGGAKISSSGRPMTAATT